MTSKMVTAGIYCRISHDPTGDLLGIDRQRVDCEALVARLGWHVAGVYVDDDLSAFTGRRRPGYEELLRDLREGRLGAVVAWHPDRLHRNPREVEAFIDVVNGARARVATVQVGEYDLSSASGRMTARVVGAVARHESEQKSERLRRQRAQEAHTGRPHGGPRPFGYEPGGLKIRPTEAQVVRDVVHRLFAGESLRSLAKDLNRREIRTTAGNPWTVTSLRLLLRRPRYAGLRVHRGEVVADAVWPGLLTRDEHEQLMVRLARQPRTTPPRRSLLSGVLRCARCDGPMGHQTRPNGKPRYYCLPEPDSHGCGRTAVTAEPLEHTVTEALFDRVDTALLGEVVRALHGITSFEDDTVITQRLAALADLYADGALTAPEWLRARRRLEERLLGGPLNRPHEPQALQLGLPTPTGVLRYAWAHLTNDQQRRVLNAAIETVTIAPTQRSGGNYDPSRVTIDWR